MASTKEIVPFNTAQAEQERLAALADYKPQEHLLEWLAYDKNLNRKVPVLYYPAAWRLYELNLRYPTANFDVEIIHMDIEKDMVIVKARLYFGTSYDESPKRSSAFKQGKLSELDRVETKAKARAARDFGIGTEHALDFDDAESGMFTDKQRVPEDRPANNRAQQQGRTVVDAVREGDPKQKPQPNIPEEESPSEDKHTTKMVPSTAIIRAKADEYIDGGWDAMKRYLAEKHGLGDMPEEAYPERVRRDAYQLIKDAANNRKAS